MTQHAKTSVNYIIDCSSITSIYDSNYFQIKEIVNMYIIALLSRKMGDYITYHNNDVNMDSFTEVFRIETPEYNELFHRLLRGNISESAFVQTYLNDRVAEVPQQVRRLIESLFDSLVYGFENIVTTVKFNQQNYLGYQVLIDTFFLNQHTLIVSFKTVRTYYGR